MSVFTLAISCLTTSNLPWVIGLIFQVPMQCCSLQHWTLLSPPVTSTTGHHSCFGSASSFLLDLFICSSPVAYWTPPDLAGSSFGVISFCLFILFMGFSRCTAFQMCCIAIWHLHTLWNGHLSKFSTSVPIQSYYSITDHFPYAAYYIPMAYL